MHIKTIAVELLWCMVPMHFDLAMAVSKYQICARESKVQGFVAGGGDEGWELLGYLRWVS